MCPSLTLGGCLAVGSGQGDNTFVDLDAHNHASLLEVLGEDFAIVGLLVHGLVEEDDAANARLDAVISGEEELAVQPPVLLSVLSIDALEALGYAAYKLGTQKRDENCMQTTLIQMFAEDFLSLVCLVFCLGHFYTCLLCNNINS